MQGYIFIWSRYFTVQVRLYISLYSSGVSERGSIYALYIRTYDNLRKTFVNDTIGRSADVIRFANLLNVIDSSFSIAIDSSWGSGKTFFVKQVKMFLDANNDHVHAIPDPDKSLFQSK